MIIAIKTKREMLDVAKIECCLRRHGSGTLM